jgi:hypothetical protein
MKINSSKLRNRIFSSFLLCGIISAGTASAQTVVTGQTALALATALTGPGVIVTNPVLTCPAGANGIFTLGASPLGIANGIVLTTGDASVAGTAATNSSSETNGTAGDATLDALSGVTTYDACVLEFDVTATGQAIEFKYQFGSEEYPDFSCTVYNDAFGFIISGGTQYVTPTNIALVPTSNLPVSVNTTTNYTGQTCNTNTAYYIDHEGAATGPVYDGLTTVFTAHADVTSGGTYHLKLGIADGSDYVLTSGVFIEAGSLTVAPPSDPYFGCHCPTPDSLHKVMIAHQTSGKKVGCQSICIDTSAIAAHLAHGDILCTTCPGTGARMMLASAEDIQILPNPNSGTFIITVPETNGSISIRVTDLTGKTVFSKTETDTHEVQVNLESYIKGVYFVEVKAGDKTYKSKLLVE